MTDKRLRKLKRAELLELLVLQEKEIESLKAKLEAAESQLESRQIKIDQCGSIAEAALRINGVFEAAQRAADQYLESIRKAD